MVSSGFVDRIARILLCCGVLAFFVLARAGRASGQTNEEGAQGTPGVVEEQVDTSVMIPSVTHWVFVKAGADSVHAWLAANQGAATDRKRLFASIRELLRQQRRFEDDLAARSYPRDQVEWLLITDAVADTLTEAAGRLLERYTKAHPEEILTDGRIQLELLLAQITGPPSKFLGFHFVRLSNFVYSRADSIALQPGFTDRIGLEDGVLRYMADWANLYQQGHADPIKVYESRLVQEDWVIARLKDKCQNSGSGTWELVEQWMAQVPDSSTTPVTFRFAHEYKLKGVKCPGDVRVLYIDLPNYREVQREVQRRADEGRLESPPASRKP